MTNLEKVRAFIPEKVIQLISSTDEDTIRLGLSLTEHSFFLWLWLTRIDAVLSEVGLYKLDNYDIVSAGELYEVVAIEQYEEETSSIEVHHPSLNPIINVVLWMSNYINEHYVQLAGLCE